MFILAGVYFCDRSDAVIDMVVKLKRLSIIVAIWVMAFVAAIFIVFFVLMPFQGIHSVVFMIFVAAFFWFAFYRLHKDLKLVGTDYLTADEKGISFWDTYGLTKARHYSLLWTDITSIKYLKTGIQNNYKMEIKTREERYWVSLSITALDASLQEIRAGIEKYYPPLS